MVLNRKFQTSLVVAVMLLVGSLTAVEAETYFTPSVMFTDDDGSRRVDDGAEGGQLALGWRLSRRWSLELTGGYSRLSGANDLRIAEGSLNFLVSLSPDTRLSPYLLAGVGMMNTNPEFGGVENSALGNLGLGILYRFGNGPVSLRLEHRLRSETANTITYDDKISTLGLQFAFGREPAPMPAPPVEREVDGDSDGDGVPDSRDACPETPDGQTVDARGCARDGDGDGVIDDADRCPNTVRGAAVDAKGCERDDDGDEVVNRLDRCPNTRAGARVDNRGCEIREIIQLPGVNFETNSDRLLPGAETVLSDAALTLRRNQDLVVEVAGHTDSAGSAAYNESLSERRAKTVRDYLVELNVNPGNLTVRGYGESLPIADNATAEGRARNRRVELRILNENFR